MKVCAVCGDKKTRMANSGYVKVRLCAVCSLMFYRSRKKREFVFSLASSQLT